jgi:hypothetical protein
MNNNKQSSVDKEFVPYEEALELKELGFDEPCLSYYTDGNYTLDKDGNKTNFVLLSAKLRGELSGHGTVRNSLFKWLKDNDRTSGELYVLSNSTTAPTFSQAFRWFREKYDLFIAIVHYENGYSINDLRRFETYEEAELTCLRKLIEIQKGLESQQ